uniref:Uncharacterized protein n=1 Tax=Brassica oleracea TaxID=3712 RepID=A0A3P6DHR9_BRAOL|nr:unnamed protein product [Brassica oleracea]
MWLEWSSACLVEVEEEEKYHTSNEQEYVSFQECGWSFLLLCI